MTRGPIWACSFICDFSDAAVIMSELRALEAVAVGPAPRWDGDRVRYYIDVDALEDDDEIACVELAIRRHCERIVGLHASPDKIVGLKRRAES